MIRVSWILTTLLVLTGALAPASAEASGTGGHKVLVFIDENHTAAEALGQMPYLASMAATYGKATDYQAVTHPSLPNYLAIAGGSTYGVTDDKGPSAHPISGASVFDQTIAAGGTARAYAETATSACDRSSSTLYLARHNRWTYFSDSGPKAHCASNDVPAGAPSVGALRNDITRGTLPTTGLVVPNACDDAHNPGCSLAGADVYLKSWMQLIKSSPDWTAGRLTVIVTFDEDDSSGNNTVAFVVADPRLHCKTVTSAATHYSLTRWLEDNAGAPHQNKAVTAPNLKAAFGL
jgi:acid phosphatase